MTAEYDVAVIGLGGIGSAAAYWCARRGARVVGLEQFELGHDRGASQDHSRIIRRSYHEPHYVELAKHAYAAWAEVEADTGARVVFKTGGLDFFPAGAAIGSEEYRAALSAQEVAYEWLDADETRARWPQFHLAENVMAIYQSDGGIAAAAIGNAAHQTGARTHGAELRERVAVRALRADGDERVIVELADGSKLTARAAVVAADAWTAGLLAEADYRLPLTVLREQVAYYSIDDPERFAVDRLPIWIWMDAPSYYGFPEFGIPGTIKIAQDVGGFPTTADTRTFDVDGDALERLTAFGRALFGAALGPVAATKTCLYTLTPDRDFVLDTLPGAPNVSLALGAAHGYKFASWFGRTLADLALDGATQHDLTPFRLDRPALTDPSFAPTWLV